MRVSAALAAVLDVCMRLHRCSCVVDVRSCVVLLKSYTVPGKGYVWNAACVQLQGRHLHCDASKQARITQARHGRGRKCGKHAKHAVYPHLTSACHDSHRRQMACGNGTARVTLNWQSTCWPFTRLYESYGAFCACIPHSTHHEYPHSQHVHVQRRSGGARIVLLSTCVRCHGHFSNSKLSRCCLKAQVRTYETGLAGRSKNAKASHHASP